MITKPKGTYDIFGNDALIYKHIESIITNYMNYYNVGYIRTPIFESSELIHRTVGDDSDIVSKETYDFIDRGNRKITLRPEATASVVRSLIENKLYGNRNDQIKYYYFGTMYRYERPQSGRNREFTQFGVEVFNSPSVVSDAETISMAYNILCELGINTTIVLNTLGDAKTRKNYIDALKEYLKPHLNDLCADCQRRFESNPLRILDCKVDSDSEIFKNLPKLSTFLSDEAKNKLNELKNLLAAMDVEFEIDETLVRGLDYYTDIVYEFHNEDGLALGGGGRYDNLVKNLGGEDIKANGFALGIERLILEIKNILSQEEEPISNPITAYIMAISDEEKYQAVKLANILRLNEISTEICPNDLSLKSQFKLADKLEASFLIILNDEDLQKGLITIKDNYTKDEEKVDENDIVDYLSNS